MSRENAKVFLTKGLEDARVVKLLQAHGRPETEADELTIYAAIAKEAGFDFPEEELLGVIEELDQERAEKTEAAISEVSELSADELEQAAGGWEDNHPYCESDFYDEDRCCKDTYLDLENCWFDDGCDCVYHHYWDYRCKRSNFCAGGYNGA